MLNKTSIGSKTGSSTLAPQSAGVDEDSQADLIFDTPLRDGFIKLRKSQNIGSKPLAPGRPPIEVAQSLSNRGRGTGFFFDDEIQEAPDPEIQEAPDSEIEEDSTRAPETNALESLCLSKEAILKYLLKLHYCEGSIKFLGTKEELDKPHHKSFAFSNIFSRCFRTKDDQEKLEQYVFVSKDSIFLINYSKQEFKKVHAEIYSSESTESIEESVIFGDHSDDSKNGFIKLPIDSVKKTMNPFGYHLKTAIIKANNEIKIHQGLLLRTSPEIGSQAIPSREPENSRYGIIEFETSPEIGSQAIPSREPENSRYGIIEFETSTTESLQQQITKQKQITKQITTRDDRLEFLLDLSHNHRSAIDLGCQEELDDSSLGCCFGKTAKKTQENRWHIRNYLFVLEDRYFVITCSKDTYEFFKRKVLKETSPRPHPITKDERDGLEYLIRHNNELSKKILLKNLDSQLMDENLKKSIREAAKKIPKQQGYANCSLLEESLSMVNSEYHEVIEPAIDSLDAHTDLTFRINILETIDEEDLGDSVASSSLSQTSGCSRALRQCFKSLGGRR